MAHSDNGLFLPTQEVRYNQWRVVVAEADVRIGTRRFRLMQQGEQSVAREAITDPDEVALRMYIYPNMVAPVVQAEGFSEWPPSYEELGRIPERFWNVWSDAVRALNAHWYREAEAAEESPKDSPSAEPEPTASTS